MTLSDLAARIDAHIKRGIGCYAKAKAGGAVSIRYEWSGKYELQKADAERYLAWLDAGNVGRHWEMEHKTPRPAEAERGMRKETTMTGSDKPAFAVGEKVTILRDGTVYDVAIVQRAERIGSWWYYRAGSHDFREDFARRWRPEDDAAAKRASDIRAIEHFAHHHLWAELPDTDLAVIAGIIWKSRGEDGES